MVVEPQLLGVRQPSRLELQWKLLNQRQLSLQLAFYPFSDYLFQFVEMVLKEMAAVFDDV